MTTLDIILLIYSGGFIINSLAACKLIDYLRKHQPEREVSPILVMVCVFLSVALWVYILIHLIVYGIKQLFRKKGGVQ